jgi:hypothetical protein
VVKDRVNGRLLKEIDEEVFYSALAWLKRLPSQEKKRLKQNAQETASRFSVSAGVEKLLGIYNHLMRQEYTARNVNDNSWMEAMRLVRAEWEIILNMSKAAGEAIKETRRQVADKVLKGGDL